MPTTVNVYRTPPLNAAGAQDMLVLAGVAVDIQPADLDPHQRDALPGVGNMMLRDWWDVWVLQLPLPDIRPGDRLVDQNATDPLTGKLTDYRVRRARAFDGLLHCEHVATPPTT